MIPPNVTPEIIAISTKRIISRFEKSGSISPSTSKTLKELKLHRGMIVKRLLRKGVLIETGESKYYLDNMNLAQYRIDRQKRILVFFIVVAISAIFYILYDILYR